MTVLPQEVIESLNRLTPLPSYDAIYSKARARKLDRKSSLVVLEQISNDLDNLGHLINKYAEKYDKKELKPLMTAFAQRKVYLVRIIKLVAFMWWEERDEQPKPVKKPWKPRFLKGEITEIVGSHLTEAQLTNTLWMIRTSHARKRLKTDSDSLLKQLIKNDENGQLEVKKSLNLHEAIGKTVSAFANTSGGKIIIGMAETDKIDTEDAYRITERFAVTGIEGDLDANRIRLTMNLGGKLTIPIERIKFDIETVQKKTVMIISVPAYRQRTQELVFYNEEAYFREDNHNRKLSTMEVFQIAKSYWSSVGAVEHEDQPEDSE